MLTTEQMYDEGYPGTYLVRPDGRAFRRFSTVTDALDQPHPDPDLTVVTIPDLRPHPDETERHG